MTIAYDLRYASDHYPGVGTHAFWLLQALLGAPGPNTYAVIGNSRLANTRFDLEPTRRHPRVRWIETTADPRNPWAAFDVGALVRTHGVDLYLSPFAAQPIHPGCPSVLTVHDAIPLRDPSCGARERWLFRMMLALARRARLVVTQSEFSRSEIASTGFPIERLRVVRPGIPGMIDPERRPADLPDEPFAVTVGINKPHKNLETLVRGWALLGETPPLRLVSAGPLDRRYPAVTELAARCGARRVTSLGRVSEGELRWLYVHATLCVFPSVYEGFGFPMAEAFVHGLPVVASDIPALRELGEGCARFVDPRDANAWRDAVVELTNDQTARERMGQAGQRRAEELTYARSATAMLGVLNEALGESR